MKGFIKKKFIIKIKTKCPDFKKSDFRHYSLLHRLMYRCKHWYECMNRCRKCYCVVKEKR